MKILNIFSYFSCTYTLEDPRVRARGALLRHRGPLRRATLPLLNENK